MRFLFAQVAGLVAFLLVFLKVEAAVDSRLGESNTLNKLTTLKDLSSTTFAKFEGASFKYHPFLRLEAGKRAIPLKHWDARSKSRNNMRLSAKSLVGKARRKNHQRSEVPHTPQTYFKRSIFPYPPRKNNLSPEQQLWYRIPTNFDPAASWWIRDYGIANVAYDESEFSQLDSLTKKSNMKSACFPFCFPPYSGKRDVFGKFLSGILKTFTLLCELFVFSTELYLGWYRRIFVYIFLFISICAPVFKKVRKT